MITPGATTGVTSVVTPGVTMGHRSHQGSPLVTLGVFLVFFSLLHDDHYYKAYKLHFQNLSFGEREKLNVSIFSLMYLFIVIFSDSF